MLLDVISVKPLDGYLLNLEFENGELRCFDMSPYMDERPFNRLKISNLFFAAKAEFGTVVWPGNIDIAPETLYDLSVSVKP